MFPYFYPGSRSLTDISERPLGFGVLMAVRSQSGSKPTSESGFLPPHSRQTWALGPGGAGVVCFLLLVPQHRSVGKEGQGPPGILPPTFLLGQMPLV